RCEEIAEFSGNDIPPHESASARLSRAVEDCAPPGSVTREDYLMPEFTMQAEALIRSIYAIAGRGSHRLAYAVRRLGRRAAAGRRPSAWNWSPRKPPDRRSNSTPSTTILRGRAARLKSNSRVAHAEAISLFEQALALDPRSVEAQSLLAASQAACSM